MCFVAVLSVYDMLLLKIRLWLDVCKDNIIKVSKPVTEFTLENEYLIPAEEPAVTVNGDKFIGGYAANTILDSGVLLWRSR